MTFSIITPSFNQPDWLRLSVASVKDQIADGGRMMANENSKFKINNSESIIPPLAVEHIIQDAGTPGIEDFAREIGAEFYRNGELVSTTSEDRRSEIEDRKTSRIAPPTSISQLPSPYRISIYCESDNGMYDAINRGLRRSSGEICAWLNCDEQYLPGTLDSVAEWFLSHPGAEVLAGDTLLLDFDLKPRAYRKAVPPNRRYIQAYQMNLHSSSLFFSRRILERNHWLGTRFRSIGDSEWIAGLLDSGIRIHCEKRPYSTFVLGKENLSASAVSIREATQWREEGNFSKAELLWLKLRNLISRAAAGAYCPRRAGATIFTTASPGHRVSLPECWLDFRFRA